MAMSNEQRKEREKEYQKKYRSSQKFKDTRKRYERSDYYREAKRQLAERTRGEEYLDYQREYRQTDNYRESIQKYRSSDKYLERFDMAYHYTEFIDDGLNNTVPKSYKQKKEQKQMIEFTDEFITDFCDEFIDWLESATYTNDSGCVVFRKEIPRTTYFQFLKHYKDKTGVRVSIAQLEKEYNSNELLRERMSEIDMMFEQLLEMYMANGKITALASRLMLTNKYKERWSDVRKNINETTIEKIVWNETLYVDAHVIEPSQLPPATPRLNTSNEDDFDFEDM